MSGRSPISPSEGDTWKRVSGLGARSRAKRIAVGAFGVLALATAVAVVTGIWGTAVQPVVEVFDGPARLLVYLAAHLGVALAGWTVWRSRRATTASDSSPLTLPTSGGSSANADSVVGGELEETLEALADPSETVSGWQRVKVKRAVESLAVDVLRRESAYDYDDIEAVLEEGPWTDDPRAAAFLGAESLPIRTQIIDWASGEPYQRKVEATVSELADIADVATEVESP